MKKFAKIIALFLLFIFLVSTIGCSSSSGCSGMKPYNSDRKRGLAH